MIEELKPHSKYKPAEMPQLGTIPTHWFEKRAKFLFREVDERSVTGNEELLSVSHKTGVTPRSQKNVTMFKAESYVGHKLCRPDDLAINTMWGWMGALGVSSHTGIISPAYGVYRPTTKGELLPRYADLLLRTPQYIAEYVCRSTGIRSSRLRIYPEQFLRIPLVYPSSDEQAAIVKFLDHADHRIRRYIRIKQKLIKLLEEQKQAIINQAVTRGLDSTVRLRPSGVDWLEEIPCHWERKAFARVARVVRGASPRPAGDSRFYYGDFIPWLTVGEVTKDDHVYLQKTESMLTYSGSEHSVKFAKGTLVLTNSGATLGVPKILAMDVCANDGIVAFNKLCPTILPQFAYYYLGTLTSRLREELRQGGTQPNLNIGIVRAIVCPVPPLEEQHAIVAYIRDKTAAAVDTIGRWKGEISLLREFRTRLISDVVTGKLDVRQAAASLPDESPDDIDVVILDDDTVDDEDVESTDEETDE